MMLDIAAAREGFMNRVICDICFVRISRNIADRLKKPMQNFSLQNVSLTRWLDASLLSSGSFTSDNEDN